MLRQRNLLDRLIILELSLLFDFSYVDDKRWSDF